jgi:hypothetical protein
VDTGSVIDLPAVCLYGLERHICGEPAAVRHINFNDGTATGYCRKHRPDEATELFEDD